MAAALVSLLAVAAVVVVTAQLGQGRSEVAPSLAPATRSVTGASTVEVVSPKWDPRAVDDPPSAPGSLTVYDLPTGVTRTIPYPAGYPPRDDSSWTWIDETTLLDSPGGGLLVDAVDGSSRRVPYGSTGPVAVDPDGNVLDLVTDEDDAVSVIDWAGGVRREVPTGDLGRLSNLAAGRSGLFAIPSGGGEPLTVVVLDRQSLGRLASLPVRDDADTSYAGGYLSVLCLADDGTVMLRVGVFGETGDGFRIVAWDPETGEVSLLEPGDPTGCVRE